MKHKIYFGFKLNYKVILLTIFLVLSLIFVTIIRDIDMRNIIINVAFYGLIAINGLWGIALYGLYKTRIEISETEIYAPFYLWYPDFKIVEDNIFFTKSIKFKAIESIEKQEITHDKNHKSVSLIKIVVKDKYTLCILLDAHDEEEANEICNMMFERISG